MLLKLIVAVILSVQGISSEKNGKLPRSLASFFRNDLIFVGKIQTIDSLQENNVWRKHKGTAVVSGKVFRGNPGSGPIQFQTKIPGKKDAPKVGEEYIFRLRLNKKLNFYEDIVMCRIDETRCNSVLKKYEFWTAEGIGDEKVKQQFIKYQDVEIGEVMAGCGKKIGGQKRACLDYVDQMKKRKVDKL